MTNHSQTTPVARMEPQRAEQPEQREGLRSAVPLADVISHEDRLEILVELPGVRAEDLEVRYEDRELSIRADRRAEGGRAIHQEFGPVRFQRVFALPGDLSGEVSAELNDGVLTLRLPKAREHQPRRIEVRAGPR